MGMTVQSLPVADAAGSEPEPKICIQVIIYSCLKTEWNASAQGDAESMRVSKNTAVLSSFILSILPFLILWAAWSALPDTIPAHWSGGVVDRWGNKLELLVVPLFSLIGSIAISVYLIVSTRRKEFADFPVRMRRDYLACYISGLLLSTTCSAITALWVQLIPTQNTAVDGGAGQSILYSLPGLYMILCALPPFYASGGSKKAERLITVLIGGAEIVLCGIVLEGPAASYAMIGLMILFCAFKILSQVRDSQSA